MVTKRCIVTMSARISLDQVAPKCKMDICNSHYIIENFYKVTLRKLPQEKFMV